MRYVGWYLLYRARGERAKALKAQDPVTQPAASVETVSELTTRAKSTWARLIRKVQDGHSHCMTQENHGRLHQPSTY